MKCPYIQRREEIQREKQHTTVIFAFNWITQIVGQTRSKHNWMKKKKTETQISICIPCIFNALAKCELYKEFARGTFYRVEYLETEAVKVIKSFFFFKNATKKNTQTFPYTKQNSKHSTLKISSFSNKVSNEYLICACSIFRHSAIIFVNSLRMSLPVSRDL